MCVFLCLYVCFFTITRKEIDLGTRKLKYVVEYENSSDKFNTELRRIKVKGHCRRSKVSPFTTIQTVKSCNSTLAQARKLILSMYVHLILIS